MSILTILDNYKLGTYCTALAETNEPQSETNVCIANGLQSQDLGGCGVRYYTQCTCSKGGPEFELESGPSSLIPCFSVQRDSGYLGLIQCTMRKLKNGVKSGQLWQIISPPIFNENSPNLEGWCKNIQKIKKIIDFPNIFKKGFLNRKKPVGGVVTR